MISRIKCLGYVNGSHDRPSTRPLLVDSIGKVAGNLAGGCCHAMCLSKVGDPLDLNESLVP